MKFQRLLLIFLFTLGIHSIGCAQQDYLIGFEKALGGSNFTYHSPYSHNEKSLLCRANKDFDPIEWETQVVPESYSIKTVSFIWLYGIDVLPQSQTFEFYVNDKYQLSFSNPTHQKEATWSIENNNGISLTFHRAMIDKHSGQMGFAVLSMPTEIIELGKSVRLKVDGVDNQSLAWYMTFKLPLENKVSAEQLKVVVKENDQMNHVIRFDMIHLAESEAATLTVEGIEKEIMLRTGLNEIDFLIPKVDEPTRLATEITIGNKTQTMLVDAEPVKQWTVHLVQHSHTDIGYTRTQAEILAEHLRYIDDALDYCDQTDHLPEDARFRWTCEASWTVREYLESRPKQQIDRLLQRIREGRIEVTGMFFNFGEIVDETALAIQAQYIRHFKEQGIDVTTAMQNDVNGIGWCMVDIYHNTGVKYLTMGQHGHRARIPFDKPTSFWWESPSGKRLLAYRSEHYMHGNTLALTSGNMDVFRNNLSEYLHDLDKKEYPLDRVALQFSGYITDNSPPSTKACAIVDAWNKKYEWPKLKLSLASEFMVYLEQNHADHLDTKKVAWPDWWSDGFGTAMNETKTSRNTHTSMIANMGLLSMAKTLGAPIPENIYDDINECFDNLLFYDEHTFGADESISNPTSQNSINQWRQKSAYVWSAFQQAGLLREKAIGIIMPYIEKTKEPGIAVFNTLNWERSGIVEVYIDHDLLPLDKAFSITDSNGNSVPAQIIRSRSDGSYWSLWISNVPPLGFANLKIEVLEKQKEFLETSKPISAVLENDAYKIRVSEQEAGVVSIFDKALQRELVDPDSPYSLGTLIYERLENRSDLERLTYLNRDTVYKPLNKEITQLESFKITKVTEGPIWSSMLMNGIIPECADEKGVDIELRIYHQNKKIELLYNMNKLAVTAPEGVYVAFPFENKDDGQLYFDVQGGVVQPGKNQLEGTSADWNVVQNFAAVRNNKSQVVFCTGEVPLVHFGDINTGHYYYRNQPKNGHIYSWVLNNYWTTNFRASQYGELNWKYQITSSQDNSISGATRFGWGKRIPMIARVNPGDVQTAEQFSKSVIDMNASENLLLVNARPVKAENGILLHLRETEGDHAILDVTRLLQIPNVKAVFEVNGIGEKVKPLTSPLLIEHFETRFILVEMKK